MSGSIFTIKGNPYVENGDVHVSSSDFEAIEKMLYRYSDQQKKLNKANERIAEFEKERKEVKKKYFHKGYNRKRETVTALINIARMYKQAYAALRKATDFYADEDRWAPFFSSDEFVTPTMHRNAVCDFDFYDGNFKKGGKLARQQNKKADKILWEQQGE